MGLQPYNYSLRSCHADIQLDGECSENTKPLPIVEQIGLHSEICIMKTVTERGEMDYIDCWKQLSAQKQKNISFVC